MTPSPHDAGQFRNRWGLPRSEVLMAITVIIGLFHHTDHVLRHDHSGWPFISEVTPLTFSLLVYPVLLSVYFARCWPWYRVVATALILIVTQAGHIWIETPRDQYHTWAAGVSDFPKSLGQPNLLDIASPNGCCGGGCVNPVINRPTANSYRVHPRCAQSPTE